MVTKKDINRLASEVTKWARDNRLGKDWGLFYNGKMKHWKYDISEHRYRQETAKSVDPLDYCEWFNERQIMSMFYDGDMYRCINGYTKPNAYKKLESILAKYGLYLEPCDSCHADFVPLGSYDNFECTFYKRERPQYIYRPSDCPDDKVKGIMIYWSDRAAAYGDKGGCVIGEHMEFRYKGRLYRMLPNSPWQGSLSWEHCVPEIKNALANIGATDIYFDYGRLD